MTRSIYVVSSEPGPVKIGIATAVRHRFSTLATASSVPLSLDFVGECDYDAAIEIEARAHDILDSAKARGEWFNAPVADAIAAVMLAAEELGYEIRQKDVFCKTRAPETGTPVMVRLQPEQLAWLDELRRCQPGIPSRAETLRRLVDQALRGKR